jgi:hypothetical protein
MEIKQYMAKLGNFAKTATLGVSLSAGTIGGLEGCAAPCDSYSGGYPKVYKGPVECSREVTTVRRERVPYCEKD